MSSPRERVASVSLDLDDKWTYMKTRGLPGWQDLPSYLDVVVPRVLRFLEERSLRITFFVVGQDAALSRNAHLLRSITDAGHEVANHSFHHEPWLHLYSRNEVESELALAEEHIEKATGRRPFGFRGPGYSVSDTVTEVLSARGYRYDASTLPTFFGPAARAYYFRTARLGTEERKRRARLYGQWRDGFRPLKPYRWPSEGAILEIPVTTMPIIRVPFHLSYLIWLSGYSEKLANAYLGTALTLCRTRGISPSFLLHPLDFLEWREAPELKFFPGMQMPLARKLKIAGLAFEHIMHRNRIITMEEHAAVAEAVCLPVSQPGAETTDASENSFSRVAYVMPVYQGQADFDDTMQNLAKSSMPCTAFVVDDGSQPPLRAPDSTQRVKICLIRLPQNQGIVRALNAGMKVALATGFEYIARIDAGDLSEPNRLERQIAYLDSHPKCMLVGSDVQICDEDGKYYFTIQPQRDPRALRATLHERAWLVHSSIMYRASVLREVGLYTDAYRAAEDYEMYLRIASHHEVGVVPETLVTSVVRKAGISMTNTRVQAISRLRIQIRYFRWIEWRSYFGALSTIATLLLPSWLKLALKTTFLYSRVPPGHLNQQQGIEIKEAGSDSSI